MFKNKFILNLFVIMFSVCPFLADAAGGLSSGTSALNTFETWMYSILGLFALVYLIYRIIQAMLEQIGWMQVAVSVGYVALAGAAVVLGDYAFSIWGTSS